MAGNCAVLKHASNVMGCALEIEKIFAKSSDIPNLFRSLLIGSAKVKKVVEHESVKAITLTGSEGAGRKVAELAGKNLKKIVLELGGSDPYIILEDADLEKAATICVKSRILNAGQTCISAKRFVVVEEIYEEFVELFAKKMKEIKSGDPMMEDVDIGPMSSKKLRDELHEQVQDSVKGGAKILVGGDVMSDDSFYPPTILVDVGKEMRAYKEELFGPVAIVIKAKNEADAIEVANDSDYGLGAAIFSEDKKRAKDIAVNKIEAGTCVVNDFVKSDPRLPFGGIKNSGFGRELSSFGIREFVNIKTVY